MKKHRAVPRTKPRYNPALTRVPTLLQRPEDRSTGHENERPTNSREETPRRQFSLFARNEKRSENESKGFKEEEEEEEGEEGEEEPREEAHEVVKRKRERQGRVSSSRQKQIAIVCAKPRQCRA
ncbi:hypothetical protein K0M31_005369 [Melipona bicolor]|uniref:Uncharacterized protein n=1 Tax=Melipona bicolor TaxID=60889 RepID=A0AA40FUY2_9HYME|nr:hypothetical protein K0M31_005369 [Melipona bicolor]